MYFVRGNTKIGAHKLAIRWYKKYEQAQVSEAWTIFDLLDKKRGGSGDFFSSLSHNFS